MFFGVFGLPKPPGIIGLCHSRDAFFAKSAVFEWLVSRSRDANQTADQSARQRVGLRHPFGI